MHKVSFQSQHRLPVEVVTGLDSLSFWIFGRARRKHALKAQGKALTRQSPARGLLYRIEAERLRFQRWRQRSFRNRYCTTNAATPASTTARLFTASDRVISAFPATRLITGRLDRALATDVTTVARPAV